MRTYHRPITSQDWSGAVKWLMIINAAVYVIQQFEPAFLIRNFGLVPRDVIHHYRLWQPVTYMFLHGGLFHLLFNMLALWMFGRPLESRWGTKEFLKYYFFTGIAAGLVNVLVTPNSPVPSIGASGAIYGLLVGFAMVYPEVTVYLYFLLPLTARQMVILFAAIELLASVSGTPSGIARFAHLGGLAAGYFYLKFWRQIKAHFKSWFSGFRVLSPRGRPTFTVHKPEDDLSKDVDRILDKILQKGASSLTPEEEEIMREFSRRNS